jgi:adenylosuccinate synthase
LGEKVLLEGAQGTFLDITYGTYPFVTSSQTIAAGICAGAGVGPTRISHTLGVVKAYTTRVGNGPFPTELFDQGIFLNHQQAREIGTTTGRKRRIGWFDAVLVRRAIMLNGIDSMAITKLDILTGLESVKICIGYQSNGVNMDTFPLTEKEFESVTPVYETHPGWQESLRDVQAVDELPVHAKNYLKRIEALCKIPVSLLSVGPERERTLALKNLFS